RFQVAKPPDAQRRAGACSPAGGRGRTSHSPAYRGRQTESLLVSRYSSADDGRDSTITGLLTVIAARDEEQGRGVLPSTCASGRHQGPSRSEEHKSELPPRANLAC